MIRPATLADVPAILDMGRAMHAESPRYRSMPFSVERVTVLAERLVPTGGVFVAWQHMGAADMPRTIERTKITGMVAAFVTEEPWSGAKFAVGMYLYVRATFRGTSACADLVDAIERYGRERGATECLMDVSTEVHAEQTAAAYERLGYARSGISLRKAL